MRGSCITEHCRVKRNLKSYYLERGQPDTRDACSSRQDRNPTPSSRLVDINRLVIRINITDKPKNDSVHMPVIVVVFGNITIRTSIATFIHRRFLHKFQHCFKKFTAVSWLETALKCASERSWSETLNCWTNRPLIGISKVRSAEARIRSREERERRRNRRLRRSDSLKTLERSWGICRAKKHDCDCFHWCDHAASKMSLFQTMTHEMKNKRNVETMRWRTTRGILGMQDEMGNIQTSTLSHQIFSEHYLSYTIHTCTSTCTMHMYVYKQIQHNCM